MLDEMERTEREWERNQREQREDLAVLHGAYDAARDPASVEWLARVTATSAVREHLIATHDAARDAALEPYADELARVNWAFYDARGAGVTLPAARETNRRIDAATLPVAAAAEAREDARLRRLGVAWERYALARLRGKYMLTVGRVFGRAA